MQRRPEIGCGQARAQPAEAITGPPIDNIAVTINGVARPCCALPPLFSCLDSRQSASQALHLRLFYRFAKLSIALAPAINAIVGDVFKGRRLLIG